MSEAIAFFQGRWMPASQVTMPLYDTGFVQGVTISEQLRTFGGRLFRLEQHLERLWRSLAIVGIEIPFSLAELAAIAREAATKNHALLAPGDDLGLAILVTPGPYTAFAPDDAPRQPTVCVHTQPVCFRLFAKKYETGQPLSVTDVRQVPDFCWPAALKCRSRMHYYLADRAAHAIDPESRALMLDENNLVTEASTANLVLYFNDHGLVSPPKEKILPGISVAALAEIAASQNIPFSYRDLTVDDVARADEAFLTSTSPCLVPATRLNLKPIGTGVPGPVGKKLLTAWSEQVGVNIPEQARQFASRRYES